MVSSRQMLQSRDGMTVLEKAVITAVRNIMKRNPHLVPNIIERIAFKEFKEAEIA